MPLLFQCFKHSVASIIGPPSLIRSHDIVRRAPEKTRSCDELNQYRNGDAVKRAKARSIGSSILGAKAKERRRRREEENRSKSARFKGLANHVSRQGSVSGSVSEP